MIPSGSSVLVAHDSFKTTAEIAVDDCDEHHAKKKRLNGDIFSN